MREAASAAGDSRALRARARAAAEGYGIDDMARKLTDLYGALLQDRHGGASSERGDVSAALYLRLLSYVRPYAKVFGLAVLGMIAAAATEPLFPALMKPLLDGGFGAGSAAASAADPVRRRHRRHLRGARRPVLQFVLLSRLGGATAWCSTCARRCSRAWCACRRNFFDDHSSGAVLSKIAYDVGGVTAAATTVLTVAVQDSITRRSGCSAGCSTSTGS